eukprot:jgi/Bigna1/79886/fgenesh1_pg.66_\
MKETPRKSPARKTPRLSLSSPLSSFKSCAFGKGMFANSSVLGIIIVCLTISTFYLSGRPGGRYAEARKSEMLKRIRAAAERDDGPKRKLSSAPQDGDTTGNSKSTTKQPTRDIPITSKNEKSRPSIHRGGDLPKGSPIAVASPGSIQLEGWPEITIEGQYEGRGFQINFLNGGDGSISLHLSIRPRGTDPARDSVSIVTNTKDRGWGLEQYALLQDWKLHENFRLTISGSDGKGMQFKLFQSNYTSPLSPQMQAAAAASSNLILSSSTSTSPILFIPIMTAPSNIARRNTQRRTWASPENLSRYKGSVKIRYVIGTTDLDDGAKAKLKAENQEHGDLLLMDFKDHYLNLTVKTAHTLTHFVYKEKAPFILKTDDDVYIRLGNVLRKLATVKTKFLWTGHFSHKGYSSRKLPIFAYGPAYMFSRDLAKRTVELYQNGKLPQLRLEDVSVGVWMKQQMDNGMVVHREDFPGMGCSQGFHIHDLDDSQMHCLWRNERRNLGIRSSANVDGEDGEDADDGEKREKKKPLSTDPQSEAAFNVCCGCKMFGLSSG